jgi:Tfp pilus assembly protein PilO
MSVAFASTMIIIAGFSIFMFYSERNAFANRVDDHATEDTKVKDMLKIAKFVKENESLVTNISSRFISATDTVEIIEDIEKLGRVSGAVTNIHSAEKTKDENSDYLIISTQASGSWSSLYKFVKSIDDLAYKHEINNLSFSEYHDEKQASSWKLETEIKIYLSNK